jgi:hypothetical protein
MEGIGDFFKRGIFWLINVQAPMPDSVRTIGIENPDIPDSVRTRGKIEETLYLGITVHHH